MVVHKLYSAFPCVTVYVFEFKDIQSSCHMNIPTRSCSDHGKTPGILESELVKTQSTFAHQLWIGPSGLFIEASNGNGAWNLQLRTLNPVNVAAKKLDIPSVLWYLWLLIMAIVQIIPIGPP